MLGLSGSVTAADNETWKITGNNFITISFNDGYQINEGNLIRDDNYMVGTYVSKSGRIGTWFGIKQNNPYEY